MKPGESIRYVMDENRISPYDLECVCHLSTTALWNILNDLRLPKRESMGFILNALGMDEYDLLMVMHGSGQGRRLVVKKCGEIFKRKRVSRRKLKTEKIITKFQRNPI